VADLRSYLIPSLTQGISQQPDGQKDPSQGEIQINAVSSIADGLRKRDSSQALAMVSGLPFGDAFTHSILRDDAEKYIAVITDSSVQVFDLLGAEIPVNAPGGYGYLASVVNAKTDIRVATVADYTFISNIKTNTAMLPDLGPPVEREYPHECLIWIRAANYGQTYTVTVNAITATVTTAVAPVVISGGTTTEYRISSEDIAAGLATALADPDITITRSGSVLHVVSDDPITLAATDARGNADITAITNNVQSFNDLPRIGPRGYQVEVVGDPTNRFDGYFVEFVPAEGRGEFGEGTWQECAAPGIEYTIDPDTMPHALIRRPDGEFYFGPLDGSPAVSEDGEVGGPGVDVPAWGGRVAGDLETAPDPGFIGFPINDLFIHKNRLGMLADEKIILSRSADFFAFFPETVTTVLESDPVELNASNNRVSILRYAVPYQDELILFSDQIQFRFGSSSDLGLTPQTAQLSVLTQYEMDRRARPLQVGPAIVFSQKNGEWTQFREFSIRGAGTALIADADSLTEYVSTYVPSGIFRLASNDTGNSWYAISDKEGFTDRIYVYKYFFRNSGSGTEKAQSSWSYWQLSGASKVLQILVQEEVLFLLVEYPDGTVWLEKMNVGDRQEDEASPVPVLLDRRVGTTTATPAALRMERGAYDPLLLQTTWTLPYDAAATTQIWSAWGGAWVGGVKLGSTDSGDTITALGDWSETDVWAGERFEMRYRFSRFKYMKDVGGGRVATNVQRTQVRRAKLRYHDTGWFQVVVAPTYRPEAVYKFDGLADGQGPKDGVFNIPVMGKGEQVVVEILNDTPHPSQFLTCEWEGLITGKSR
jgi:hypothetical protein